MLSLLQGWVPPTLANWQLTVAFYQYVFPIVRSVPSASHTHSTANHPKMASLQWVLKWYGMGKTSVSSALNLPGRLAWLTMEITGPLVLLTSMNTLPTQLGIANHDGLPWQNKVLSALYVIHYAYRAVAFPFLQPSMSPIHAFVWAAALLHQFCNGTSVGAWLAAYGPTTDSQWAQQVSLPQFALGISLFYVGLAANFFHDEELREIRRREARRQEVVNAQAKNQGRDVNVEKHYRIPTAGLFKYMLYPHYFCEWVEWFGFWMACGWSSVPARAFLINEIFSMLPRAVNGRKWYVETFGEDKIKGKWAVIPGLI